MSISLGMRIERPRNTRSLSLLVTIMSAAMGNIDSPVRHMVNKSVLLIDTPAELALQIAF